MTISRSKIIDNYRGGLNIVLMIDDDFNNGKGGSFGFKVVKLSNF